MPTIFIAVQCFQCSTMQVKQQKKSSNKWTCVVCNQKQSQRKVFAQGFMAKDLRKYVQSFNMSRQISDQKQFLEDEIEVLSCPRNEQRPRNEQKTNKRTDWSEYVDEKDENWGEFNVDEELAEGDSGFEGMVVTEMPKALFKKPKLKDYSSSGYGDKLLKPVFRNRSNAKRHKNDQTQDIILTEFDQTPCERAPKRAQYICSDETPMGLNPLDRDSKRNRFRAVIQDNSNNLAKRNESFVCQPMERVDKSISKWTDYITQDEETYKNEKPTAGLSGVIAVNKPVPNSKWSSYMTEEDVDYDLDVGGRKESRDDFISQRRNDDAFESLVNDERVEEDIHPDFL